MAQPAHTRNDAHPPGDGDIYEGSTEERFVGHPIADVPSYSIDLRIFDTARKFWVNGGRGIAEFTSRNFVSMDTNFRRESSGFLPDANHPLPVATGTTYVPLSHLGIGGGSHLGLTFVHSLITDAYSGRSIPNERASTYSIFSADLEPGRFASMRTTLNRFNFERNYQELFPRAIAYSAGLINYYFRGRFQIEQVSEADTLVTVLVRNVSAAEFSLRRDEQTPGFQLFYDARDGRRREIQFQRALSDSTWAFDETREFSFVRPADVDTRNERSYVLVFDGTIGNERGLAAASFGGVEGGLLVTPKYPTSDATQGARTITWREGAWRINDDDGGQAGTIDWKGSRPGDVLSWGTSRQRYRHETGGTIVYMSGRALTSGPHDAYGPVLGASIRYVNGERTLNLVKRTPIGGGIRIYSRKFAHAYENEEPWSEANPLGWRLIHAGNHGLPYTGFFFNASGNEGQYITQDINASGPLRRVKITLQGDRAFAVDYPAVATITRTDRSVRRDTIDVNVDEGVCEVRPGAPTGELFPNPGDACGAAGYSGDRNNLHILSATEQYADKTLLCVDYRGDQEVFCELEEPEGGLVRSTVSDTRIHQRYFTAPHCTGRETRHSAVTETARTNNSNARVLRVGNAEVPWTSVSSSNAQIDTHSGSFYHPPDYSGSRSNTWDHVYRTTYLIFADARHDFAVYESSLLRLTGSAAGTFVEDGPYHYPITANEQVAQRKEVQLLLGAHRQALFEEETTQESTQTSTTIQGQLPMQLGGCAPTPGSSDVSTVSTYRDTAADNLSYSPMSGHGSYAIDRSGRLGLSQWIFFEGPYVNHGHRNVLTGGDLPALFPGAAPADGYSYDIRLIR